MTVPSEQDFAAAVALWREWNARINVISRKDEDNIFAHHILHSLAIVRYLEIHYPDEFCDAEETLSRRPSCSAGPLPSELGPLPLSRGWRRSCETNPSASQSFLDVGTGGGFPGIPLAMVMPGAHFTLCDSIGKKVKVAQAVADSLGLENVECVNARVESLSGQWDWIVSRAVTSLENFYPWVRGRFRRSILYLKGGDIASEIAALRQKHRVPEENIRTWRVSSWLDDEYFAEKFVIEVGKNYLCTPKVEN